MTILRRTLASIAIAALAGAPAAAFAADPGDVPSGVTVRQSVKTQLSPTGTPGTSRVFTQVVSGAAGTVTLPSQSTDDLRNLTGYGRPDVDGDAVSWDFDDAGARRSVADFDADLPVEVAVSYALDGEPVEPGDVAGASGLLTVTYEVTNRTGVEQELTYKDAQGNKLTETTNVAVPLVGSLSTVLDGRFRDVEAPGGVVVGDGRGNTVLNFSLLLFPPLGNETATLSYTARVSDAAVPPTTVQILPVDSDSFRSLATAEETYRSAASDVYTLTQGALDIDRNLLRLATGLGQLLDGVNRLADGSADLHAGLGDAASGSGELSAGLSKARAGGGELSAGLQRLGAGAGELSAGLTKARDGGDQLDAGLERLATGAGDLRAGLKKARGGGDELDAGLVRLAGGAGQLLGGLELLKDGLNDGLPTAIEGVSLLSAGVTKVLAGIGTNAAANPADPKTLTDGLAALKLGLSNPDALNPAHPGYNPTCSDPTKLPCGLREGLTLAKGGLDNPTNPTCEPSATNPCGVKQGGQVIGAGLDEMATEVAGAVTLLETVVLPKLEDPDEAVAAGTLSAVIAEIGDTTPATCEDARAALVASGGDPTMRVALKLFSCGAGSIVSGADQLRAGLQKLDDGIGSAAVDKTLLNGIAKLMGGLDNPAAFDETNPGYNPTCADPTKLPCGVVQALTLVNGGLGDLGGGLQGALDEVNAGLGSTDVPGETLLFGMGQLSDGANTASHGMSALADGLGQLHDGSKQLASGAGDASDGMSSLADGLGQLDDGGKQLADGAGDASNGAGQLADGLVQLDDGGKKLADGLISAEDGAGQIANGLALARIGANTASNGASELQRRGTGVLVESVNGAAADTNLTLAQVRAADARGRSDALPYGAPEGAAATVVYQFDIAGVGAESGPGDGIRIVTAVGGFGLAGGLGLLGRRRLGLG